MLTDEIFPILEKLIDGAAEERLAPAMWVGPIAGALLISLGLIMLVNGLARNRQYLTCIAAKPESGI